MYILLVIFILGFMYMGSKASSVYVSGDDIIEDPDLEKAYKMLKEGDVESVLIRHDDPQSLVPSIVSKEDSNTMVVNLSYMMSLNPVFYQMTVIYMSIKSKIKNPDLIILMFKSKPKSLSFTVGPTGKDITNLKKSIGNKSTKILTLTSYKTYEPHLRHILSLPENSDEALDLVHEQVFNIFSPSYEERKDILESYTFDLRRSDALDIHGVAMRTVGFNEFDLKELVNIAGKKAISNFEANGLKDDLMLNNKVMDEAFSSMVAKPRMSEKLLSDETIRYYATYIAGVSLMSFLDGSEFTHLMPKTVGESSSMRLINKDNKLIILKEDMSQNIKRFLGGKISCANFIGKTAVLQADQKEVNSYTNEESSNNRVNLISVEEHNFIYDYVDKIVNENAELIGDASDFIVENEFISSDYFKDKKINKPEQDLTSAMKDKIDERELLKNELFKDRNSNDRLEEKIEKDTSKTSDGRGAFLGKNKNYESTKSSQNDLRNNLESSNLKENDLVIEDEIFDDEDQILIDDISDNAVKQESSKEINTEQNNDTKQVNEKEESVETNIDDKKNDDGLDEKAQLESDSLESNASENLDKEDSESIKNDKKISSESQMDSDKSNNDKELNDEESHKKDDFIDEIEAPDEVVEEVLEGDLVLEDDSEEHLVINEEKDQFSEDVEEEDDLIDQSLVEEISIDEDEIPDVIIDEMDIPDIEVDDVNMEELDIDIDLEIDIDENISNDVSSESESLNDENYDNNFSSESTSKEGDNGSLNISEDFEFEIDEEDSLEDLEDVYEDDLDDELDDLIPKLEDLE